jgi:hypothetical protein
VILGGTAAPELCMIPEAGPRSVEDIRAMWGTDRRLNQIKVDGINAMYVDARIIGGREGGPLDCALHCQPGLKRLEEAIGSPMVFFGEYSAHDGFTATLAEQAAHKGSGVFWLYDAVPHGAWVTGNEYLVPIEERLESLRTAFRAADTGLFVGFLDWWMLDGEETAAKAREVWEAGFEGLVSKEAGSPYVRRRSHRWIKVKQIHRHACSIVDVLYRDGKVRSVVLRAPDAAGVKPITITGGWSPTEGRLIDQRASDGVSMCAEIEFELTVGAPRSIRGAKWRRLLGNKETVS